VENQGMSDTLLSRFLRYVRIDTQSDETSKTFPSTSGQLVLLGMLKQELSELGAADVQMTRHGYVVASIPPTPVKPACQQWPFSPMWTQRRTVPVKT
jgi:di/tripeptidase